MAYCPEFGVDVTVKEFVFRASPGILLGTRDVNAVRIVCGDEEMLVEGHRVLVVGVFIIIFAEPIGEAVDDLFDGFAVVASCD